MTSFLLAVHPPIGVHDEFDGVMVMLVKLNVQLCTLSWDGHLRSPF